MLHNIIIRLILSSDGANISIFFVLHFTHSHHNLQGEEYQLHSTDKKVGKLAQTQTADRRQRLKSVLFPKGGLSANIIGGKCLRCPWGVEFSWELTPLETVHCGSTVEYPCSPDKETVTGGITARSPPPRLSMLQTFVTRGQCCSVGPALWK